MAVILSGQTIRKRGIFTPFAERTKLQGMSYGVGPAGYDVRVREEIILAPGEFKRAVADKPVVENDIRALQRAHRPQRQQVGIAGSCANKGDGPALFFERSQRHLSSRTGW